MHAEAAAATAVVPGLHNLNNTCYLNAALQALASSQHFTAFIATAAEAFEATAQQPDDSQTLLQQLQAVIKSAVHFVWQGEAFVAFLCGN